MTFELFRQWYYLFFYWPLNGSDSVVLFVFLLTFELFRQCGIMFFYWPLNCSDWYYLFFYWPLNCSDSVVLCVFHFITIYRLFSCLLLNHGSIVIMWFLFSVILYWIKFITFLVVCVILLYFRIFKWYSNLYPSILSISIPIKLTTY